MKRFWSRALLVLLAAALVLTTACSGGAGTDTTAATTAAATTTTAAASTAATTTRSATTAVTGTTATTPAATTATQAPQQVEEGVTITMYHPGGEVTDLDMVCEYIDQYVFDKIGVHVEAHSMIGSDYTEKGPVMMNSGTEMDLVLCNAGYGNAISDMVKVGALQPIDDYMDLIADTVAVLPDNIWKDATYQGKIWGIPFYKNRVRNYDFIYNATLAETLGLTEYMNAFQWEFYPDLMEQLYPVKEAMDNAGMDVPYVSTFSGPGPSSPRAFAAIDSLMGDNAKKCYCVTNIDGEVGIPEYGYGEVYNAYGTDTYKDWCHLAYQWVADGIIPPDDTKNIDPDNALRDNGELFCFGSSGLTSIAANSWSNDWDAVLIRSNKACGLSNASNGVQCVPVTCKHIREALMVANLFHSDEYLATVCRYGIENTHWIYDDEGVVTLEFEGSRNADSSNRGYYYWYGWTWGNLFIVHPARQSADPTFVQDLYNLNEVGSSVSKYYGFIVDITDVADQVANCDAVVSQYMEQCGNGRMETIEEIDATLATFNEELAANGMADVNALAQTQLEAYAAENGLD